MGFCLSYNVSLNIKYKIKINKIMSTDAVAIVFPGQGSQAVGMLGDLSSTFKQIKETFDEASNALGRDLWALAQNGPIEELNFTQNTQPLILTASIAM